MDIIGLDKIQLNFNLYSDSNEIQQVIALIDKLVDKLRKVEDIYCRKINVAIKSRGFKYAIIDFECNPPKVFGLLLFNRIYQFYVKSEAKVLNLHVVLLKILSILKDFYFFAFSLLESRFIKDILPHKVKKVRTLEETAYLKNIKIINV